MDLHVFASIKHRGICLEVEGFLLWPSLGLEEVEVEGTLLELIISLQRIDTTIPSF
jgi:hypothetical protein